MLHLQDSLRKNLENRRSAKCEARQTMNVVEGIGSSNGINYAYTLNNYPWHASYEWRVHRSMLDRSCKIHTNRFSVDGIKWRIVLTHLDNGQVVARLKSWKWRRFCAHYSFTLVNHTNSMKNACRSRSDCFPMKGYEEMDPIMKASEIKDPFSGYLKDDMFTLRMDLRMRCRSNEICSWNIREHASTCQWSLKYAWEMCPSTIRTDVFKIGDREMQLEFCEERSLNGKRGMSVLLRNLSPLPIHVRGALKMRNRRDMEFVERMDAGSAKGWIQILQEYDFVDGCSVKDGWLTLTTNIVLLKPQDFEKALILIPKLTSPDTHSEIDVKSKLKTERGEGVINGGKHAHMMTRHNSCASYKWFVHRSLMETPNKTIFTNPFSVERTQWVIELRHSEDGSLKCYLYSKNGTPVGVQFEFTLVNFADAKKSVGNGNCHTFSFVNDCLGFSFLPCTEIKSCDLGYVREDYLMIRLDLRLKHAGNESCQIFVDGNSATCKWKLRRVREMDPPYLRTDMFRLGDAQLQVLLRPNDTEGSGPLEIFVHNLHHEHVRMQGKVRVIHHFGSTNDDRVKDFHGILSPGNWQGSGIILKREELKNEWMGFVRDDWIAFEIQIVQLSEEQFDAMVSPTTQLPDEMLCAEKLPIHDDLMHVKEGSGSYDGSSYTFILNKYQYYATHECCVDRSLLDNVNSQIVTEAFGLSDGKWKIALVHKDTGKLETLLCYEGETWATAHFSFIVVNYNDSKKDLVLGDFRTFSPEVHHNKWGFDLCPIATISDPSLGFLRHGRFMVRLELRLKLQENEIWETSITQKTARCTWKLKNLKDLSPLLLKSEIFKIDGTEWRLRLCPNGETSDSEGLEMYLINKQHHPIRARIGFCAVHQKSLTASEDRIRGFTKIIDALSGWGVSKLLDSDELVDESLGFVDDGWITIAAKITVLDEDAIPHAAFCKSAPTSSVPHDTKEHACHSHASVKPLHGSLDVGQATKCPECQEIEDQMIVPATSMENQELERSRCQITKAPILIDDGPNK